MEPVSLIFATNNQNKVIEIQSLIPNHIRVQSLVQAGIDIEIPEPHETLSENAREKSTVIHQLTQLNCFGEDSGLEVVVLDGAPGVRSARYAGEEKNFQANIDKLMQKLEGEPNRTAQFRTVISLIWNNTEYQFEGICAGRIATTQAGTEGFGYDPVFIPDGSNKRFGEMSLAEKNVFSHRKKAMQQLIDFLSTK